MVKQLIYTLLLLGTMPLVAMSLQPNTQVLDFFDRYDNQFTNQGDPIECSICQNMIEQGEQFADVLCTHKFHQACLLEWRITQRETQPVGSCPICRSYTTNGDVAFLLRDVYDQEKVKDVVKDLMNTLAVANNKNDTAFDILGLAASYGNAHAVRLLLADTNFQLTHPMLRHALRQSLKKPYANAGTNYRATTFLLEKKLNELSPASKQLRKRLIQRRNSV